MTFFACALDTNRRGVSAAARQRIQSVFTRRALAYRWHDLPGAAACTGVGDRVDEPAFVSHGVHAALGTVRLDNRADIARRVDINSEGASDLELVLHAVARHGARCIPDLLGDFAFVVWDSSTRTAIAACDAFAVKQLYYCADWEGLTLFGSHAEPISMDREYDRARLADLLSVDCLRPDSTVYAGVSQLPPGTRALVQKGVITQERYWSAMRLPPPVGAPIDADEAIATCRDLLVTSVRLRLDSARPTWAQLSGGIDSSAVVSIAQWLFENGKVPRGLAGTVTYVFGQHSAADERSFSDTIVQRWGIRNEQIVDPPLWYDANADLPPIPDQPSIGSPLDPVGQSQTAVVRASGGRVLLTGWGSDQLFTGSMVYFADQLAKGQVTRAISEMAHIAALGRVSFWSIAYQNAVLPYLPSMAQRRFARSMYAIPAWLRKESFHRLGVAGAIPNDRFKGKPGQKYFHYLLSEIALLERSGDQLTLGHGLESRHPFLYRPLVEFASRLPPQLCARPHARKWVLREAMNGILPALVRTRVGKGGSSDIGHRSFAESRALFAPLVRDPILADLGLVDGRRLREAWDRAATVWQTSDPVQSDMLRTLSIEAWLQMRSGRWPHGVISPHSSIRRFHQEML
jgi:asparagine synthase (glutamine-hydrolysing)